MDPQQLAAGAVVEPVPPAAQHISDVIRPDDDARSTIRGPSPADDSLAIFFDGVLYHNRMVQAAHQQARRDMATQTEETIVAPELGAAEAALLFGDGGCRGTTPASAAAVSRLEKRRHDGGDDDGAAAVRCAICIEDFEVGDGLSVMPCSHLFHEGCVAKWLARSRLCPCCRHALPH